MILFKIVWRTVKPLAVNTKSGFVVHATRFSVVIKALAPMEAMVVPVAFPAVATAAASSSASSSLPAPLGESMVSTYQYYKNVTVIFPLEVTTVHMKYLFQRTGMSTTSQRSDELFLPMTTFCLFWYINVDFLL
jgi:hypothetical protein